MVGTQTFCLQLSGDHLEMQDVPQGVKVTKILRKAKPAQHDELVLAALTAS